MDSGIKERCDLMIENRRRLQDIFAYGNKKIVFSAAAIISSYGIPADKKKIIFCKNLLKKRVDILSGLRGQMYPVLVIKMALSSDPEDYLRRVKKIYSILRTRIGSGYDYSALASIILCDKTSEEYYERVAARTIEIYNAMKNKHFIITSYEDIPFCVLLSFLNISTPEIIHETEKNYNLLKNFFLDSNAVQSLSHILTFDRNQAESKCTRVRGILNELNKMHHKYGKSYELPMLGLIASIQLPNEILAGMIAETENYLALQKGFNNLGITSKTLLMFAAMVIVQQFNCTNSDITGVHVNSVLSGTDAADIAAVLCCISSCSNDCMV